MSAGAEDDGPQLPRDFTVDDFLRAPLPPPEPDLDQLEREARSALWELDFALQELEWFKREGVREGALLESIIRQIRIGAQHVERFPEALGPLPDDLRDSLAERFGRLTEELEGLPADWAGHEDIHAAERSLRASLERRGVDLD